MARKILLADDSVTAQNMGRKILADAGYEVITVNNGSAALKKISEHRPDLIVLDVYMPGYSGLEVCQRLKEVAETARIPVLLTVGKLEPFKTDEAKRVRADGFIVKPFEASELLSALSKLEDKIVPRAEASKPGRLARANAAIEEGRDKTAAEDDSGWKNRISFPSKKKETSAETNPDDPAVYNPVNKDLRTVIDHHRPSEKPKDKSEDRVDLGALAPEGLPKDVTPEEIAALAAAAAQVQGKMLESKAEEARQEAASSAPVESKTENPEANVEVRTAEAVPEAVPAATFAENVEAVPAAASVSQADSTDIDATHTPATVAAQDANSGNGSWPHDVTSRPSEAPVTMAAAAGVGSGTAAFHWTAVAVALAPEDHGISLEQEMQQAYTTFAAADSGHSASMATTASTETTEVALPAISTEAVTSEAIQPSPATVAPEAARAVSEAASAATEAVSPAVKDFETVSAPYVPDTTVASTDSSPSGVSESISAPEAAQTIEAPSQPTPAAVAEEPGVQTLSSDPQPSQATYEDRPVEESKIAEVVAPVESASTSDIPADNTAPEQVSSDAIPATTGESAVKNAQDGHEKESEIAATTAAAWASWRRVRESSDTSSRQTEPSQNQDSSSDSHDAAAMAVAAGAENSPEEAKAFSDDSDPAIASIVDSVLADLRPKIVEEISRKLGKKK